MVKSKYYFVLIVFAFMGCGQKYADSTAYSNYVNNPKNGLVKSKELDGLVFDVIFNTPELMAIKEAKVTGNEKELSKLVQDYQGMYYFNMRVSSATKGQHVLTAIDKDRSEILDMDRYMNFDMQNDFFLLAGKDTAQCVLYATDKTYGASKCLTVSLGFDKKGNAMNDKDMELVYDDKIFGKGIVRFTISGKDIASVPKLKLEL